MDIKWHDVGEEEGTSEITNSNLENVPIKGELYSSCFSERIELENIDTIPKHIIKNYVCM